MDLTSEYRRRFADDDTQWNAAKRLKGQKVLFVRGFLSEATLAIGEALRCTDQWNALVDDLIRQPALSALAELEQRWKTRLPFNLAAPEFLDVIQNHLSDRAQLGDYFDGQVEWVREQGVDVECVAIESEAAISDNATKIIKRFQGSDDIWVITHSKGCLDTLQALLTDGDDRVNRVKHWIAIQGPFGGTPIADFVYAHKRLLDVATRLLEAFHGEQAGLTDMRPSAMANRLRIHAEPVGAMLDRIRPLCFASSLAPEHVGRTFLGTPLLLIHALTRQPNDGLVPADSAILPGARYVRVDDVDHAMPVMRSVAPFDRLRSLQALICLA